MLPLLALVLGAAVARPDTSVYPLQEVVVTGTRASESALRLPAGVSVVRREAFADTRGNSLADALTGVPGVLVQSRAGSQDVRVTIRGFGARGNGERSNVGNMRGIRVLTDGVSVTEPDGRTSLDLVDLGAADRVEVVRSNASALYGNASGGVVHLRTDLAFERPYVEYRERAGSFGYHREQAVAGFGVSGARGVFSISNSTFEGWRAHSSGSATQASLRLAVPVGDRDRLGVLMDAVSDLNRFPGALTRAEADADPAQANPDYITRDERRRNRVGRVALTWDRAVEESMDLALTAYAEPKVLQRSERSRFRDFTRYHVGGSGMWSWRSTLAPGIRNRLSLGADDAHQDGAILFYSLGPGGTRGTTPRANKREGANAAGGFVDDEVSFGEHWSVRVAARWDVLWYVSENYLDRAIDPAENASKTFRRLTPKASLSYRAGLHTIYAAVGGGVEAPAFNEIDPPPTIPPTSLNPFLEPMYSETYELGAKGQADSGWLGRLSYDAALYWIEVHNEIVPFDGGAYFFSAGRSRRKGGELGLSWRPGLSGLSLTGTLAASDNRYVRYANELGDFADHHVPGLPDVNFHAGARYQAPAGLFGEVDVQQTGSYYADDLNSVSARAYVLLNATAGYEWAAGDRRARVFVGGNNLTDERYDASVFINGGGGRFFEPGLPANWMAGLTLRGF